GQTLVTDLGGRGENDVIDALRRELRVAPEDLAHGLYRHVVGACLRKEAVRGRPAERRSDAVDVHDLAKLRHGGTILPGDGRLGATRRLCAGAIRGRRRAAPGRSRRAAAAADAYGERRLGGRSLAAHARPP